MPTAVLIIDDDPSFRKLLELKLKSFLTQPKFTIHPNLTSAREHLSKEKASYDLVILDQHLPDGRGLELLSEGWFTDLGVLAVSSDTDPEMPGATIQAGATYFLNKVHISEPLFKPLVLGIIDRNRLQRELSEAKLNSAILDTVKKLVSTLRHEINNPLGAVMGAAYLMQGDDQANQSQKDAAKIVE